MSVRKRKDGNGAWVADYRDQHGNRKQQTFKTKREAMDFHATAHVEVRDGTHVADSDSITVAEAGRIWLDVAKNGAGERRPVGTTTYDQYDEHVRLHIKPFLGDTLLSRLTVPGVNAFGDTLRKNGRAPTMVRYAIRSLGSILSEAQQRGLIVRNVVAEYRRGRRSTKKADDRAKRKLVVGVDIPLPSEIKAILAASLEFPFWRPIIVTDPFTGLRASELRGLPWPNVDLDGAEIHVRQMADRKNVIQPFAKSAAGYRTVPIPPIVVNTLREWKLRCPKGPHNLVFPNPEGGVQYLNTIVESGFQKMQIAAGVTAQATDKHGALLFDKDGAPIIGAKYTGLHSLRHFFASWCINRKRDGGRELPPKNVQKLMGHSSITVTLDTYGHLFPSDNDREELASAERLLLA